MSSTEHAEAGKGEMFKGDPPEVVMLKNLRRHEISATIVCGTVDG